MAKKTQPPKALPNIVKVPASKPRKPTAVEVGPPTFSSKVDGTITPSRIRGSYMTVDPAMDSGPITFTLETKEQPGPQFEPIVNSSDESGPRETDIPEEYLTKAMGFTLLASYRGTSQGKPAASRVEEAHVSFYSAVESEAFAPKLRHRKIVSSTPTYDMKDHKGDEQVNVPVPDLAQEGDQLYCTIATEQDAARHIFYHLVDGYVLTAEDASSGRILHFFIRRGWLARRKPWRVLTNQTAYITSGLPADPPADVPAHLETQLPGNANEIAYRDSVALIVDSEIDKPPPHLRQSVDYNGEWCLNPEFTKNGGNLDVPNLDTYAGDRICFYLSGTGHVSKPLGCVTVENDGDLPTIELSPCDIACFFNEEMTLTYTLDFPNSEEPQQSPERRVNVLVPQFPHSDIEEATKGIVDLRTFPGNPMALVPVWDYAECAKCCWMWITGALEDGSAYRFDILVGELVTDAWKANGIDTPILRAELQKLADCSEFELHFAASFCEARDVASAFEFPAHTFKIEQEALELIAPTVTEAVLTDLTAYNGRDGVHVEVMYVGSNPKHSIIVCWKRPNGACWLLTPKPGSTTGAVVWSLPPEAVIESMGKVVEITYTVTTACKVQTSPPLNLGITLPVRLETPNLRQATPPRTQNAIVDTRAFAGGADSFIDWMWFLRAGHKCWLRAKGIDSSGAPYSYIVYAGRTITTAEEAAATEVAGPVLRSELMKAKDQSSMTYTFSVVTDGSGLESNAIVCPSRVLTVRVITMVTEDLSSLPYGQYPAGTSVIAPTMTIRAQSGTVGIHAANPAVPGMTSGNAIALNCAATTEGPMPTQTVDLFLKRGYSRVRFSFTRNAYYGVCYFYDAGGSLLGTRSGMPLNSWVDFNAPGDKYVAKISIFNQQHSYLDGFELYF